MNICSSIDLMQKPATYFLVFFKFLECIQNLKAGTCFSVVYLSHDFFLQRGGQINISDDTSCKEIKCFNFKRELCKMEYIFRLSNNLIRNIFFLYTFYLI